eukprot:jgi/Undpi1/4563/HiC_scaffold_18.g07917.m1
MRAPTIGLRFIACEYGGCCLVSPVKTDASDGPLLQWRTSPWYSHWRRRGPRTAAKSASADSFSHCRRLGIAVELSEVLKVGEDLADGEYAETLSAYALAEEYGGVDPIDADCPAAGKCIGLLTRDGSLELDSRYGCTKPFEESSDDDDDAWWRRTTCGVYYELSVAYPEVSTLASVRIALHPESIRTLAVELNGDVVVEEWEVPAGSTELQEIPGLKGLDGSDLEIKAVMEDGEYFAILEVEIYVEVDDVPVVGTSASTRIDISATATTDSSSVMNTLDGDATDSSSWTCLSGEVCEIVYDLQAPESLEQLRIAFSEASDAGGQLNVMAAGSSGVYSTVREGIVAGGRPVGSDGLQTFGGVRALARYVKIEVVPSSGESIIINEVEFRVGDSAPVRPVAEKAWLKPTGSLPLGSDPSTSRDPNFDLRTAADGGCDSPAHFKGCHVYYIKDGDMDSRWTCGPLAIGSSFYRFEDCDLDFSLNYYRYMRQIQLAFHMGDEQHDEFSIEALTVQGWMTVVPSAISSGDSTDYQTFDVNVHALTIRLVPKFQRFNQWFSVKEMIILERRQNAFIEGTVPVFYLYENFENDDDSSTSDESADDEVPTRFKFDIPKVNENIRVVLDDSTFTGLRMRFPADREFEFEVSYGRSSSDGYETVIESFTSAGGENTWETFTLSEPAEISGGSSVRLTAIKGPTFAHKPDYPALRVVDLQVLGERSVKGPGYFNMVTTAMPEWARIPDIIGDGVSDQEDIMTAICETKGATFDGTDCVGELDDTIVYITLKKGDYFIDGPVFLKSGVTLDGEYSDDSPNWTTFLLYEDSNTVQTGEDAIMVIDGVEYISFQRVEEGTGDIVPGTIGNICMDVRNSQDLRFAEIVPGGCRSSAAHFTDSRNITTFIFWGATFETGNYLELTRVDDFYIKGFPDMGGLLMDTCNNIVWEGYDEFEVPTPRLSVPTGGDQTANVVVTGDSSGIVFQNCDVGPGAEPRILVESTEPLTLDNILDYEEAVSGDCIVQVPEGSADDLIVQVNVAEQTLSKSGNCWVLD